MISVALLSSWFLWFLGSSFLLVTFGNHYLIRPLNPLAKIMNSWWLSCRNDAFYFIIVFILVWLSSFRRYMKDIIYFDWYCQCQSSLLIMWCPGPRAGYVSNGQGSGSSCIRIHIILSGKKFKDRKTANTNESPITPTAVPGTSATSTTPTAPDEYEFDSSDEEVSIVSGIWAITCFQYQSTGKFHLICEFSQLLIWKSELAGAGSQVVFGMPSVHWNTSLYCISSHIGRTRI